MESKRSKRRKVVRHGGTKPLCSQFITGGGFQTPWNAFTAACEDDDQDIDREGWMDFDRSLFCIISRLVQQTISETEVFGRIPELMKKSSEVVVMVMMMVMMMTMMMMMRATIHWWSWCLRVTAIQSLAGCETTNFNSSTSQLFKYNEGSFTSLPCLSL